MKPIYLLLLLAGLPVLGNPVPEDLLSAWTASYEGELPEAGVVFPEEGPWRIYLAGMPAEAEEESSGVKRWVIVPLAAGPDPRLAEFLLWAVSNEGQTLAESAGFVSLPSATRLKQTTILKVASGRRVLDEHAIYPPLVPPAIRPDPEDDFPPEEDDEAFPEEEPASASGSGSASEPQAEP